MSQTEEDFLGVIPNSWPENFADKFLRLWLRARERNEKKKVKRVMKDGGGTVVSCKMKKEKKNKDKICFVSAATPSESHFWLGFLLLRWITQ